MAPASGITVLVVDDNDLDRRLVSNILKQAGYETAVADSAASARALLHTLRVALVVSDLRMPGESGMRLVEHIRAEYPDVAVLVTSADGAQQTAADLTTIGAHGYLVKPFGIEQFLVGVANALRRHDLEQERNRVEERLEEAVRARTIELTRSREEMVRRLALAVTARDGETGRHSERASDYSWLIATGIGLPPGTCELIRAAAPLHDIGKIAIPDRILGKPGPLTLAERRIIETHTTLGYDILAGSGEELLDLAAAIALSHHEWLDGTGYPHGLAGNDIPLPARIVAVADVFEALTNDRPYRRALPQSQALQMVKNARGTHLDPRLVDALAAAVESHVAVNQTGRAQRCAAVTAAQLVGPVV